jgi:putative tryptophan/tyrosine transport system substrate-binding protein
MRRREAITLIVGMTAGWPFVARSQQSPIPTIGFLDSGVQKASTARIAEFDKGLAELGYAQHRNVMVEYRWAEGRYDQLPALANELVTLQVSVIAAMGSPNAAMAAQKATTTIPIVFANGGDPVKLGLVPSLSRPGGNSTGVSFFNSALVGKRWGLVRQLVPVASKVAFIVNPKNPNTESDITEALAAAHTLSLEVLVIQMASANDFDPAFAKAREQTDVAILNNDAYFSSARDELVAVASRHRIPTIYYLKDFIKSGGLISYGTDIPDIYRQAGIYAARILKGAKPAELPVMLPTRFELAINLNTAKALGLPVPQTLLATADEVIE